MVDADGLIKLGKSGALGILLSAAEVLVPEAVYGEAVTEGKKEMHEDAFELEQALEGGARIIPELTGDEREERAEELLRNTPSLGAGERAALRVFFARGADAVLTDDRVFANLLGREGIAVLLPTAAIVLMAEQGTMDTERAVEALGKIEGLVRRPVYEAAMEELDELIGKKEGER